MVVTGIKISNSRGLKVSLKTIWPFLELWRLWTQTGPFCTKKSKRKCNQNKRDNKRIRQGTTNMWTAVNMLSKQTPPPSIENQLRMPLKYHFVHYSLSPLNFNSSLKGAGSFHIHRKTMKELGILALLGIRERPNLAQNLVTHWHW